MNTKKDWIMNQDGRVAFVTGAASGMGLCFSQSWVALGGSVVLCDVNEKALQAAVESIPDGKERLLPLLCNVADYDSVVSARDAAVRTFGRIDLAVSFAGGTAVRIHKVPKEIEFPDVPIQVYDWGIDVNLKGPFYVAHAVMAQMREQREGLIVNIGSITGAEGSKKSVDYATSKAGLMYGLTKSLAQYGASYNVRCVCVSPGPVLTRAAMAKMKTLAGRAGEAQEIVDLILFLASEKGQFINGENIMIDGGRNAMTRRSE